MRARWIGLVAMGVALAGAANARAQSCDDFDECTTNDMCSGEECIGTPTSTGSCDDFNDCTVNDRCDTTLGCTGDPAPPGTSCGGGCGTCEQLVPVPGSPVQCVGDLEDNGSPCDTTSFGPCLSGSCLIQGIPGFPSIAFCLPQPRECPDAGNCRGGCNPETDQCDNSLPRCFGACERCEGNTCVPANQGNACDDFNECTSQSRCDTLEILGQPRGLCLMGVPSGDTPTPTATGGVVNTPTVTRTQGTPPTPGACVGDCNGDGMIAINELISGVNIALGNAALSTCPSFDSNGDGSVAINELISGVNGALNGCA
jgi:hypothetical protein